MMSNEFQALYQRLRFQTGFWFAAPGGGLSALALHVAGVWSI